MISQVHAFILSLPVIKRVIMEVDLHVMEGIKIKVDSGGRVCVKALAGS